MDSWPPEYTLRKSSKAKHVSFKASLKRGLEIIVPLRFNQKHLLAILAKHQSWIEKAVLELQKQRARTAIQLLPQEISFPAITHCWQVYYRQTTASSVRILTKESQQVILSGNIANKQLCQKALINFAKIQAKIHLPPLLQMLSVWTQLSYRSVTIRGQEKRWGSCSTRKDISLNYKLLFLSPQHVRHVMLHELCHLAHMNHSAKFWRLVASFDPDWKKNSREVRHMQNWLPWWV